MYDAGCERTSEAERVSDRDNKLARPYRIVPKDGRRQTGGWQLKLRQILVVVSCFKVGRKGLPIPQFDQVCSFSEDVGIGDDRSFGVPDHSRPGTLPSRTCTADVNRGPA
jgi:hypothetical protein